MKFREVKGLVQSDAGVRIHLRFLVATLHPFPSVLLQSSELGFLNHCGWVNMCVCVHVYVHMGIFLGRWSLDFLFASQES